MQVGYHRGDTFQFYLSPMYLLQQIFFGCMQKNYVSLPPQIEKYNAMNQPIEQVSLWGLLESITENLKSHRLADVFRFISFYSGEKYGPHSHRRIEINYVKKGNCLLRLDNEVVTFREGEMMIITSDVNHLFEAGPEGTTLMQLEFLPDIFSGFGQQMEVKGNDSRDSTSAHSNALSPVFLFSDENKLIKIVNNVRIMRAVQRIVNELEAKSAYYQYLVVMYYAELLVLVYRYLDEAYLPLCSNEGLRRAIAYLRTHFGDPISMADVANEAAVSERQLRNLFAQHLNIKPLDYLNQIRVNKAVELLRNTELSVKEVCFQCGFQSPQYFSRLFKQQTGLTPREVAK